MEKIYQVSQGENPTAKAEQNSSPNLLAAPRWVKVTKICLQIINDLPIGVPQGWGLPPFPPRRQNARRTAHEEGISFNCLRSETLSYIDPQPLQQNSGKSCSTYTAPPPVSPFMHIACFLASYLASLGPAMRTMNVSTRSARTLTKDVKESLLISLRRDTGRTQNAPTTKITQFRSASVPSVKPEAKTICGIVSPTCLLYTSPSPRD